VIGHMKPFNVISTLKLSMSQYHRIRMTEDCKYVLTGDQHPNAKHEFIEIVWDSPSVSK
jgi:hypothetical protein